MAEATGETQAVVAVYPSHELAEHAILELKKCGFDLTSLSIIGRDYRKEEHVLGFYNMGDRVATWGKSGAFWGGLWGGWFGLFFGTGFFLFPGIGPLVVAGPVLGWVVGILEGAVVIGGLSALGAALYSMGIPKDHVLKYETDLRSGRFVLVAHGSHETLLKAKNILDVNAHQYDLTQRATADQPLASASA